MITSILSNRTILGRLLRLPLRAIPAGARLPIQCGPLRGRRWVVGSGNHGYWLGIYEKEQQVGLQQCLSAGETFYDVGAHAGFYSLLASTLVGPNGRVVAFEPSPGNLKYLREHLRLNDVENVQVLAAAVSDTAGVGAFDDGLNSAMGSLRAGGAREVAMIRLDDVVERGIAPPPDCLKMDIEGGELKALMGAETILSRNRPHLFLSTHSADLHHDCRDYLVSLKYMVTPVSGNSDARDDVLHAVPEEEARDTSMGSMLEAPGEP